MYHISTTSLECYPSDWFLSHLSQSTDGMDPTSSKCLGTTKSKDSLAQRFEGLTELLTTPIGKDLLYEANP